MDLALVCNPKAPLLNTGQNKHFTPTTGSHIVHVTSKACMPELRVPYTISNSEVFKCHIIWPQAQNALSGYFLHILRIYHPTVILEINTDSFWPRVSLAHTKRCFAVANILLVILVVFSSSSILQISLRLTVLSIPSGVIQWRV